MFAPRLYVAAFAAALSLGVPSLAAAEASADATAPHDIKELTAAARAGEAEAAYELGIVYRDGLGVPTDPAQAVRWFRKAAEQGLPRAHHQLGRMLERGEGAPKNPTEAAEWYEKAAQAGVAPAMFALGQLYRDGRGVAKNEEAAAGWFRAAAERNFVPAQLAFAILRQKGLGVAKDEDDAAQWFARAARQGSAEGAYRMALLLLNRTPETVLGHGPSRTVIQAMNWLERAARQDYAPAEYALATAHMDGIDAPLDTNLAVSYLFRAADQGLPEALFDLGLLYKDGLAGLAQNPGRAYLYLSLAAERGAEAEDALKEVTAQLPASQLPAAKRRVRDWKDMRGL
ncbi:MAG: tetratricopeptide repeat protein [Rhodospirillaceae bacterium]|nr:tetratricopeptide repeat protein [Rhodospirillaceae bacterium]